MTDHGFIDEQEPLRRRIEALEAQIAAMADKDDHDNGDYYTFTKAELDKRDADIARAASVRALREAADELIPFPSQNYGAFPWGAQTWLRDRADRIEGGGQHG